MKRNHTQVEVEMSKRTEIGSFPALGLPHGGVEHFAKAKALCSAQGREFQEDTENHHVANRVK